MERWRKKLDQELRDNLNRLLSRIKLNENAYRSSLNPREAQIWTALAELNLKISRLENKIKSMEKGKRKISSEVREALKSY
jgi:uncharacterized lipoprotein YmbA